MTTSFIIDIRNKMAPSVQHVVADAGAFIRNAALGELAEKIYSIPEVISESCDRATRARFKVLPFDIIFKQPSSEALLLVTDFAKKTGDYRSLSAVDLKVLALVYDLEKQFKGTDHIRKEPQKGPVWNVGGTGDSNSKKPLTVTEGDAISSNQIEGLEDGDEDKDETVDDDAESQDVNTDANDNDTEVMDENGDVQGEMNEEEDASIEDEEEEEEEDDDDEEEGWITPSNVDSVKRTMGINTSKTGDTLCVGCMTTDFAMQNVLIQMGLNVISIGGLLIRQARSYVMRCFGCMRITKDTTKVFCPHCGNKTLRRLTATIAEDGTLKYYLAKNYTISKRGTQFSLPAPKGGKYAMNPRLCEDQPMPQQRVTKKAREKFDIMSADIVVGSSPFKVTDVTSKSAQLGFLNRTVPQWAKRNPNENRKSSSKNRRKK